MQTERAEIVKRDTGGLDAEIAALNSERVAYLRELSEDLEPKLDRLLAEEAALTARVGTMREAARAAFAARRGALRNCVGGDAARVRVARMEVFDPAVVVSARKALAGLDPKGAGALAASERSRAREAADAARSHGRVAERELAEACATWRIENPLRAVTYRPSKASPGCGGNTRRSRATNCAATAIKRPVPRPRCAA